MSNKTEHTFKPKSRHVVCSYVAVVQFQFIHEINKIPYPPPSHTTKVTQRRNVVSWQVLNPSLCESHTKRRVPIAQSKLLSSLNARWKYLSAHKVPFYYQLTKFPFIYCQTSRYNPSTYLSPLKLKWFPVLYLALCREEPSREEPTMPRNTCCLHPKSY